MSTTEILVSEVVSAPVVPVAPNASVSEVRAIADAKSIHHFPIVADRRLVGSGQAVLVEPVLNGAGADLDHGRCRSCALANAGEKASARALQHKPGFGADCE